MVCARTLTLSLAFALPTQEAAPPPTAVTVGMAAAHPGDRWHITSTVEQQLAVVCTVRGAALRDFEQKSYDQSAFDVEITASPTGDLAAEVRYGDCKSRLGRPTFDDERSLDFDHQNYVVSHTPSDPNATELPATLTVLARVAEPLGAEPVAVTSEIAAHVGHDAREPLAGGFLAELLAHHKLELGASFEVPLELGSELLDDLLQQGKLTRFTLTPIGAGAGANSAGDASVAGVRFTAALAAKMVADPKSSDLPIETTFELAGEIVVRQIDGRMLACTLAGPIRCAGSSQQGDATVEVQGTGTVAWKYQAEPRAKTDAKEK